MQYLWGFLSGISLITVLSLISVSVPGLANQVSMYLLSLAQMNIIPANEITDLVVEVTDPAVSAARILSNRRQYTPESSHPPS